MKSPLYIHASAIALDDAAILISGASKAGKSTLAEALIALAQASGHRAALIGDDRVGLVEEAGALLVRPHPAIAGLIERRGVGIAHVPFQPQAVARLEIALTAPLGEAPAWSRIERVPGLSLPLLVVQPRPQAEALWPLVLGGRAA
jgi:serine kinase of HPr protein (carbohydrate metabolism regulator)